MQNRKSRQNSQRPCFLRPPGQGLTEFIVIVLLVAVVVLVSVRIFGHSIRCQFSNTSRQIDTDTEAHSDCAVLSQPVEEPENPPAPPPPPGTPPPPPSTTPTPDPTVVFDNPTLSGAPVDRCVNYAKNCDKVAAESFCHLMGYSSAVTYALGPLVDRTYIIGDGSFCQTFPPYSPFCGPFSSITCRR